MAIHFNRRISKTYVATFLRGAGGVEVRLEPVELGADRHARRRSYDAAQQQDGPVERRGAGHREVDAAGEVGSLVQVRAHQRQVQRHRCVYSSQHHRPFI